MSFQVSVRAARWLKVAFDSIIFMRVSFYDAEHMLFYASEKYPIEDSYSKFIAEVLASFIVKFVLFMHSWHILWT